MYKTHEREGIALMILACFLAAVLMNLVREVGQVLPTTQVVVIRNIMTALLFVPVTLMAVPIRELRTRRLRTYGFRALIGLVAMLLWFHSVVVNPITVATALSFTSPLFTMILAMAIFGETLSMVRLMALLTGFLGTIVILRPGSALFDPNVLYPLAASFLWSISSITIKSLSLSDRPLVVSFFMAWVMCILSLPLAFVEWQPIPQTLWLTLAALGVIAVVFQYVLTKAIAVAPFAVILPYDFTRLIFTALIAYLAFGEVLDIWTVVGALVILSSAVYATYRHRQEKHRPLT